MSRCQSTLPSDVRSPYVCRSRLETKTYLPATKAGPRKRPPRRRLQITCPVLARRAPTRPSKPPTKIRPCATAGVAYPHELTLECQTVWPSRADTAKIPPDREIVNRRLPSVDALA